MCSNHGLSKKRPTVKTGNSSHILVSWENVFQGNCEKDLDTVSLVINNQDNIVNFNQKEALVPGNPCLQILVFIRLTYINNNIVVSPKALFNFRTYHGWISTIYAEMLKDTVSEWICLKEKGTVTFLEPPEAFAACVISRGD